MASNLEAMASNLLAMASNNLRAKASNLRAMASNLLTSDGLKDNLREHVQQMRHKHLPHVAGVLLATGLHLLQPGTGRSRGQRLLLC